MKKSRMNLITQLLLTSVFSTTVAQQAMAVDFNSVTSGIPLGSVSSGSSADYASDPSSAPNQAPSQASLTTYQPQSVVSGKYISNMFTGTATYGDVAALTPGAISTPINGYGGADQVTLSIHGFQDGQYNVLFDGIPFADGADQTHHQNQFMMATDMGSEVVDRGPGRADTVGLSTFGGTVFVNSKDPLQNAGITTRVQYGSFNTRLIGAEFDTGDLKNYGDARGFIDINHSQTDGAYALNTVRRTNIFGKLIKPINDDNTVTIAGMVNDTYQHITPRGATLDQIAANGGVTPGLSTDPLSQLSYNANHDHFSNYMFYVQLQSQHGKWSFDNKLFTTEYTHINTQTANPGGNTLTNSNINGTPSATTTLGGTPITPNTNDLLGNTSLTQNTTYGDVFRGKYNFGRDDLGFGVWVNRQTEQANQYATDFTGGYQYVNGNNQQYFMAYNTYQPYVEYTWRPIKNLEVTPGVKYDYVSQEELAANVNGGGSGLNGYGSSSNIAILPSLDVHYYLRPNWTIYGQVAQGFVPPQVAQLFATTTTNSLAQAPGLSPEKTMNYQLGSVYKTDRYSLSGDVYFINNNNLLQANGLTSAGYTVYTNSGNANFSGIDTEATYKVGYGYSLYGNFTFERTQTAAASPIFDAPAVTSALGLLYAKNNFNANLIAKEVGSSIGGQISNQNITVGSYTLVNFAAGYKFTHIYGYNHDTEVQFQANNLTDRYGPMFYRASSNVSNPANPMFYTFFGRTYNVSLSTTF